MKTSAADDGAPILAGPGAKRPAREMALLVAAAVALQLIVWAILLQVFERGLGYHLHDLSDTSHYLYYAERVAHGGWPYADYPYEYPPLSLLFIVLPPLNGTLAGYERWFTVEMIAVCSLTAMVTTVAAARLWSGLGRPLGAAAAFAAAVAAAGAISVNRFDPVVGLVVALTVLALVCRRWVLAGVAAGLGFSLKLTPIVLLPLVLVLAGTRRGAVRVCAACAAVAIIPFVPFLVRDASGVTSRLFGFQVGRGLQIESLAATPYLLAQVVHHGAVTVVVPPGGSLAIAGPGTTLLAWLAPLAILVLLAFVYAAVWRSRETLRADLSWAPVAALAAMLAAMCGNKILSPQHLLWVLPLVALGLVAKRPLQRAPAALVLAALVLTQIEFPAWYHRVQQLDSLPLLVISARNVLLLTALVVAAIGLWRARAEQAS